MGGHLGKQESRLIPVSQARPLIQAVKDGNMRRIHILLVSGIDIEDADGDGNNALHHCVHLHREVTLEVLLAYARNLDKGNSDGYTPLIIAVRRGYVQGVRLLLQYGASVCTKPPGGSGRTALHHAVMPSACTEVLEMLLDSDDCIVNIAADDGSTPLMEAARGCQVEAAHLLLSHGADVIATDNQHQTALHHTINKKRKPSSKSKVPVIGLLLQALQCGVAMADSGGRTPLALAILKDNHREAVCLLENGGTIEDTNVKCDMGYSLLLHASKWDRGPMLYYILTHPGYVPDASGHPSCVLAALLKGNLLAMRLLHAEDVNLNRSIKATSTRLEESEISREWLALVSMPRMLLELSRLAVRRCLVSCHQGKPMQQYVTMLGLPSALQRYLVFPHLTVDVGEHSASCYHEEDNQVDHISLCEEVR